jgi:hypothetical protein
MGCEPFHDFYLIVERGPYWFKTLNFCGDVTKWQPIPGLWMWKHV